MSNRNQRTRDPPHLLSAITQPTKTCAGPSIHPPLYPLIYHSSTHPPVRTWRDPVRLTDVSCRQVESSLTRALSEPGVPRQLNLSSGQSEESGSRPISLHYGTVLLLHCRVPVVLQGRCCLIHHQGTKGPGWGVGKGGGPFLPPRDTHTRSNPPPRFPETSALQLCST